jgi:hypothetical protein
MKKEIAGDVSICFGFKRDKSQLEGAGGTFCPKNLATTRAYQSISQFLVLRKNHSWTERIVTIDNGEVES